jgi:hypothetical protein
VGTLLLVDEAGWPKRWDGGAFHHCFSVDPRQAAFAEAAAQRMSELSGIPRTEAGACNVEWVLDTEVGHTYSNLHGTPRSIVFATVHLHAADPQAVALHEAGHVLGLGHSPKPDHLMNVTTDRQRDFASEELAVLAWIYGR